MEQNQAEHDTYIRRLQSLTDENVAQISQNGDDMAMEYLLAKYKPLIKRIARGFFLVGADAEDLMQEATIGLLKAIKHYSAEKAAKFSTFAELCIKHQIISAIQMANRKKHGPLNSYVSLDMPLSDADNECTLKDILSDAQNPEQMMISNEQFRWLQHSVDHQLSKLEKQVFLEYIAGRSYSEIAKHINKTEKAVDNAIQRIRKKLIRILCDKND